MGTLLACTSRGGKGNENGNDHSTISKVENMFGLTKREQRWKADQQAADTLVSLVVGIVKSAAEIRIAEARTDADELARLRAENIELKDKLTACQAQLRRMAEEEGK